MVHIDGNPRPKKAFCWFTFSDLNRIWSNWPTASKTSNVNKTINKCRWYIILSCININLPMILYNYRLYNILLQVLCPCNTIVLNAIPLFQANIILISWGREGLTSPPLLISASGEMSSVGGGHPSLPLVTPKNVLKKKGWRSCTFGSGKNNAIFWMNNIQ